MRGSFRVKLLGRSPRRYSEREWRRAATRLAILSFFVSAVCEETRPLLRAAGARQVPAYAQHSRINSRRASAHVYTDSISTYSSAP